MTTQTISLDLKVEQPKSMPALYGQRWPDLIKAVGQYDAPFLIFLGELLGLLDNDPAPKFTCARYSSVDMFGGRDQDWTLRTRHARIHRQISQAISESWQRVEVETDLVQITGLPQDIFIEWDGDLIAELELTVGNIVQELEPDILRIAHELFAAVEHTRVAASKQDKLRAELRREYRTVGASTSANAADLDQLTAALLDTDSDVGIAALERLKVMDQSDPNVQTAMISTLEQAHWIVRKAAAKAMQLERQPLYFVALVCALDDQDGNVREAAADALGWMGNPEALPALLPLLNDATAKVRWSAVATVGKLLKTKTEPDIIAALIPLLSDEDRYVRSATVSVLAECRHPGLIEPFIERLTDWNDSIRRTAAWALGNWGDPRAVDGLTALLTDSEDNVQKEVKAALKKLGASTQTPVKSNKRDQAAGKTARKVKSHKNRK